ncbi:MAG: glycosyltransferase family 39 protein [Anaerolineae bacterium]|nr:glycosyltransferase family 39 protein [Anaerolineae bacterium]
MSSNKSLPVKANTWKKYLPLVGAVLLAAVVKSVLILQELVPFNSDEAVVSLMARHILQGARPVFFYGQAYMGSLDAWLVAIGFRIFGEHVMVVRLVQSVLYLGYIVTVWALARRLFEDRLIANLAVFLAAVPTVLVSTYTTATLGGYGESLIFGNLILLLGFDVTFGKMQERGWAWFSLGLLGGVAFWVLGLAGVYLLPVGLIGLWRFSKKHIPRYGLAAAGLILGSSPWWVYNLAHGSAAWATLAGPAGIDTSIGARVVGFLLLGLTALLGMRSPWSPEFIAWPLLLVSMIFYLAVAFFMWWGWKNKQPQMSAGGRSLLSTFTIVFTLVFVGTSFGIDATGRYLLPMYVAIIFASAAMIGTIWRNQKYIGVGLLLMVMAVNGISTWKAALSADGLTTQFDPITSFDNQHDEALMEFLVAQGETVGYSNYWVSFRLAFLSGETIIFSPELPYKLDLSYTYRDNRYPVYAAIADASEKTAYITSKHPDFDQVLVEKFEALGVAYQEAQIGEYHIFYDLSRAVRPEELGYGDAAP